MRAVIASVLVLVGALPSAAATQHSQNETGETNEFGAIRTPYQLEISGQTLVVEARVVLDEHYDDQKAAFFMFAFDTQNSPSVDATFVALETAGGDPLVVNDKQGVGSELEKWFVDVEDMPEPGTKIIMRAEVGAKSKGFFSLGAMVVVFNYKWEDVRMANGDQAKLYGFTQVGVNKETGGSGGQRFGAPGNGKLPVPGFEAVLLAAGLVGVALATRRRRL